MESRRQQAAEALQAAQQVNPSGDKPFGSIATLKDVLSKYSTIREFSESFSSTTTGKLSLWFEDSDQAFSDLALIGASNAQLDGIFSGSNFMSGQTVQQLLEMWDKCLAWMVASSACNARIVSVAKVACNHAGHSSQHVTQHHANLAFSIASLQQGGAVLEVPFGTTSH